MTARKTRAKSTRRRSSSQGERKVVARLKLADPVHYAGEVIEELEFYRARGKDVKAVANAVEDGEGTALVVMLARATDLPEEVIEELDIEDLAAAEDLVDTRCGYSKLVKKGSAKGSRRRAR